MKLCISKKKFGNGESPKDIKNSVFDYDVIDFGNQGYQWNLFFPPWKKLRKRLHEQVGLPDPMKSVL